MEPFVKAVGYFFNFGGPAPTPEDNSPNNLPVEDKFKCYHLETIRKRISNLQVQAFDTIIEVVNQDTLLAAHDLLQRIRTVKPETIAILDMANAKKPGGYYEDSMVVAQEEELIRRSPALLNHLAAAKKLEIRTI